MSASIGWTIHRYASVTSTQYVAADLIARGAAHRTAVVADRQTAGYGRKGDRWLDAAGDSLLLTLILRPEAHGTPATTTRIYLYPMAAALAVLDAVHALTGVRGAIKWPNDLLLRGGKVGGILGDATWSGGLPDSLRIGVGVNLRGTPDGFAARGLPGAMSVAAGTGHELDRDVLLNALLRAFAGYDDALAREDSAAVVSAWRASVATIGQAVVATLTDGRMVRGTAVAVTDDGDVLIAEAGGQQTRLSAPSVRSLRTAKDAGAPDRSP
jgi:BirA family biotin operon repressor/biotin-[acetyl-CoA-carboxylase] ligase